ncbi:hypothetical protein V2J09_018128 [Rumex salicifolius]
MRPPPSPAILLLAFFHLFLCSAVAASSSSLTALLNLKSSLQSSNPNLFSTWLPTAASPCNFTGVTCGADKDTVTGIDLSNRNLSGSSLPYSSLCTHLPSLQYLAFGFNSISGALSSADFKNCTNLRYLDLGNNAFSGAFPDISSLTNLEHLYLNASGFTASFPWNSLTGMSSLSTLSVGDNQFDLTPFPEAILKLANLTRIYMSNCSISGSIPAGIGSLSKLEDLEISDNSLTGEIPSEITKLKNLWQLELYGNSLTGTIPVGFSNLTNLQFFDASQNKLHGDLSELRTLNKLISLQLFENEFSGELPAEFGEFKNLVNLSLYTNNLTGTLPEKLGSWAEFNFIDVSTNAFTGPIPPDMCKSGKMNKLLILQNNFTGEIPASYATCTTLLRFRVSDNSLTGTVPPGIWGLPNADIIDVADNFFEGPITADIGNAKSLGKLLASNNRLSGSLPEEISRAVSLVTFDVNTNQITGQIPRSIGQLDNLNNLYLQNNKFTGEIPDSLSSSDHLSEIDLAHNSLSGQIPASLGSLQTLYSLNLSYNSLSGEIPSTLSSIRLSLLDLSYNNLQGPIPESLTMEAYNQSFLGNNGLCSRSGILLRPCSVSGSSQSPTLIICLVIGFIVVIGLTGCYSYLRIRASAINKDRQLSFKDGSSWDMKSYHVLTFNENEILDSIKQDNLVGKGGCGTVYKVKLREGQEVAVKHILTADSGDQKKVRLGTPMLSRSRRSKEFDTEVKLLSSIRHLNVVKLYCSITSEDSSLLVYEYLGNGSLWDRLHTCKTVALDWPKRHEIALGAARGLEYLHHGCDRPVIHRDIKSSNILLDEKLKPKIADFGLAKIVQSNTGLESTHVIAGTHGYIAPEYGYTYKVNEKSDVYSLGVVLMELVTGKRPIEAEYGESKDIVSWVSGNLNSKESVVSMVDTSIPEPLKEDAIKVLKIAILCTTRLPDLRPSMRTVVQMLEDADPCRLQCIVIGKHGSVKRGESP